MVSVTVRYFAQVRELTARESETLEFDSPCDESAMKETISARHSGSRDLLQSCRIAHNHAFLAREAVELADGDELAVIPPVSGG